VKQNRFIYHYSAMAGNVSYSGIAQLTFRIVTQEDLNRLKDMVRDSSEMPKEWVISSLSYHGREFDIHSPVDIDDAPAGHACDACIDVLTALGFNHKEARLKEVLAEIERLKNRPLTAVSCGADGHSSAADDLATATISANEIRAAAQRLRQRYICNEGTELEFIACVTPEKSSIGSGGVWDDWKTLATVIDAHEVKQ
jgi:hypothetical protein